jgi:tyrosyl-tRNA synthetase
MPIDFLAELRWRGMVHQMTDGLDARLARGPVTAYVGFDPTADSLHVGHLIPVFGLIHLQRAGGVPVALVGGGTGMIGDPSGRSAERNLLDAETLDRNARAIGDQLARFLDFTPGPNAARMIDNREWLARYGLIDFLRDIGKHFTVGYMLAKDSVQIRLESGLSFTEFSYMTLQAADFLHLHRDYGVDLQMGGADQWGNITAGTELIRRVMGLDEDGQPRAHALVHPLLTLPSGAKFGKTEDRSIFLAADRTPPFAFYQYWVNTDDRDLPQLLRFLTLMGRDEIESLEVQHAAHPERRTAQRALAMDLTTRVHGPAVADLQRRASEVLFSGEITEDPAVLEEVYEHSSEQTVLSAETVRQGALALAVSSGAYSSNSEARRGITQGGLSINGQRIATADDAAPPAIGGCWYLVRTGRRRVRVARVASV